MVQTLPLEHRETYDNISNLAFKVAAWIPALLICYSVLIDPLINYGLVMGIDVSGFNIGGGRKNTTFAKFYFPFLFVLAFVCFVLAKPAIRPGLFAIAAVGFAYLLFALLSTLWSVSPSQTQQAALYSLLIYATLFLSITTARTIDSLLVPLTVLFVIAVAVNLVFVSMTQAEPSGHVGIYDHKNNLGAFAACAFFFGLFSIRSFDLRRIAGFGLFVIGTLVLIYLSNSKTSQALTLLAPLLAVTYVVSRTMLHSGFVLTTILVVGMLWSGFLVAGELFKFTFDDFLLAFYGDTTFTGRTDIWAFVNSYIADAPLLGHGYRGFWALGIDSPKHLSNIDFIRTIGSAHNGFLDVLLDLGSVGLSVVIVLIFVTFSAIGHATRRPAAQTLLFFSIVLFALGRNLTESVVMWSTFVDNLLFMSVGLMAAIPSAAEKAKSSDPDRFVPPRASYLT